MAADRPCVLFWHRRDLRGVDNRGLAAAAAEGSVVPVFCLDDDLLRYAGAGRVAFMLEALTDLQAWYRTRGGNLVVERGSPEDVLVDLAEEIGADTVILNEDYSGFATERDEAVEAALGDEDVRVSRTTDLVLHEPGSITTNTGDPYSVFGYYWEKWRHRGVDAPADPPSADRLESIDAEPVPNPTDLGFEEPTIDRPIGTREAAEDRLTAFLDVPIFDYAETRDLPAADGTSRLSQDLKFGLLGVREVFRGTQQAAAESTGDALESVREYQRQLAWREFYLQVLDAHPETVVENYVDYPNPIEWRSDPAEVAAWKRGETGYPLVDAGMRQLLAEGYVHNRVRMVAASFLTKDLLADWRIGYRWYREHLIDHDTANEAGGWQWAASTGTDPQPYFRVFNPTTQCERFDPDAAYVRRHVPELADASTATIHDWPTIDPSARRSAAPDYPDPIVDHARRRAAAIEAFKRARGGGDSGDTS